MWQGGNCYIARIKQKKCCLVWRETEILVFKFFKKFISSSVETQNSHFKLYPKATCFNILWESKNFRRGTNFKKKKKIYSFIIMSVSTECQKHSEHCMFQKQYLVNVPCPWHEEDGSLWGDGNVIHTCMGSIFPTLICTHVCHYSHLA